MERSEETTLRGLVRTKLAEGVLPRADPVRTWAGPGTGYVCIVCGALIPRDDMEYELQFDEDTETLRFHRLCQTIWDRERKRN